ncbi:MAG: hypothetical protein V4792_08960 [Pseudomonadota bacterium]
MTALSIEASAQSPLLTVRPEPSRDPWWQRATHTPRATVVHGMSIKRFEPGWCAAEVFTRELFGDVLLGPSAASALDGLTFTLESSFDGSGKLQTAFVGTYRRCDGEQGLFVAITDRRGERQRMRFLVEVPDPGTAFAALGLAPDGSLTVWWCLACDKGHRIAYNRETGGFYVAGPALRR